MKRDSLKRQQRPQKAGTREANSQGQKSVVHQSSHQNLRVLLEPRLRRVFECVEFFTNFLKRYN